MNNYLEFFKGKKVTQMGLGLLGRGVGDVLFLAECGAEVLVTDIKTEGELKDSIDKLRGVAGITFKLGGHDLADFKDRDMILKSAGVPLDSIYIVEARKNSIPIYMGAALFTKLSSGIITIGITGTRGKSTTTHLIHHILKTDGKTAHLGGNVRDVATLPMLKEVKEGDYAVLELDSWQLQGFEDMKISPNISVFTTFMDDHMNYYNGDREQYFKDKSSIYRYQSAGDTIVAGEEVSVVIASKGGYKSELVVANRSDVPKDWQIKIPGEHNLLNISCAIHAALALGVSMDSIKKGVESFIGVEGRLQFVREIRGVKIYNDNNATTPDATIAALRSFDAGKIVLICGGSDKGLDLNALEQEIKKSCKAVIILPGTGSDRLKVDAVKAQNLEEAVSKAMEVSAGGDIILFSPAFASFGSFKNEYDRNDQFLDIIGKIHD